MKGFVRPILFSLLASSVFAQTPPSFPASVLGQRQVNWNYTGLRPISAVPAIGVHPRVFIGPADRAEVCNRLTNTWAGQELFTNYVQRYTALLKNSRSVYDSLSNSIKLMPDGTARLGNVGFYNDPYFYYTNLVAGQTNNIDSLMTNGAGSVYARTMAGELALEGLECWVLQGQTNVATRATNLAVAMDTWATYLLGRSDFTQSASTTGAPINWMLGGGAAFAEAYDFNFWAMNSNQCAHVRSAIARVMYAAPYQGANVTPEADVSNWVSLDGFQLIMAMAMEGETSVAVEGFDANYFNAYITNAMGSFYKFLTYGWHPTGEMYEGMGKGWFGGARLIAFAKRGYNFFGHPHLLNYVKNVWPACLQPFGYSWTHYDLIGGEGTDNLRGLRYYTAEDQIAMQWVYTNLPAAAFLWRNFVTTAWCSNGPATGTNNYSAFLDFRDSKFVVSTVYGQDLLEAALFVQNPATNVDWNVQNASIRTNLDFVDTCGSTIVGRSDYSSNAVAFQFHTRQDFGGHTYAERGGFSISGLGRNWVWFPYALNYGQDSGFSSMVLVDDLAMYVTPEEGDKMRIPAKLAAWSSQTNALFATCDSTYCYTWAWKWNNFTNTGTMTVDTGYQRETNCFNTFLRSNNQIPESYGNTPFWQYPHWLNAGNLEGIERTNYNSMQQVIRTAGLVRGAKPYVFVADDIQKDYSPHTYKWLLQIPKDLTLKTGASLPMGFNPATDCVLSEDRTNGNRSLLVRFMSPTNWAAYTETVSNAAKNSEQFYRLTVAATNVAPAFKVMLYPFAATDPIPTNTWMVTNVFTVAIGNQTDTFTFSPRAYATTDGRNVTMSEFQLTRGGTNLMDYRNQIEPFAASVPTVASFTATPTTGINPLAVVFTDNSTGFIITNRIWDFGDGAGLTTNAAVPIAHTYTNPGIYTVQLIVRSQSGSGTNTATNYIVAVSSAAPPAAPSYLSAVQLGRSLVRLTWTDSAVNEVGYFIERSVGSNTSYSVIGSAGPNVTTYNDTAITPAATYYYRVRAWNGATNYSDYGNETWLTLAGTNAWQYSLPITFAGYNRTEILTNFPALVVLGTNVSGFDYNSFVSPTGGDLRFKNASGADLNYEIENWNPVGQSHVWVQVPEFTNNATIVARWGDLTATNPPAYATNGAAWASNFLAVWHLNQTPPAIVSDSSTNNNAATPCANLTAVNRVSGLAGGALDFNGTNNWLNVATNQPLKLTGGKFTLSAWVNLGAADDGVIMGKGQNGSTWYSWFLSVGNNPGVDNGNTMNRLCVGIRTSNASGKIIATQTNDVALASWVYVAGTLDGTKLTLSVNGLPNSSTSTSSAPYDNTNQIWIGSDLNRNYLNGRMDELRVENAARSTNWIWAVYQNIASNSAFAGYGSASLTTQAVANFTTTPTNGGVPLAVTFNDTSTGAGITNRQWDFGDGPGLNTTLTTVTHIYTNVGSYTVTLSVSGLSGTSANAQSVSAAAVPAIGGISLVGTNLVVTGSNGAAGAGYLVLAATNLLLPLTNWNVIATNQFGAGGVANFTNPLNPNAPQIYYRLRLP